jgi:PAS domain S-box-containing protein
MVLGLAGIVALLIVNAVLSYRNIRQLDSDARWVVHTHEVMDALAEIDGHLRQAEAVQRAYIITGGATMPLAFKQNIDLARKKVGEVKILTQDNLEQQNRLPTIEKNIEDLQGAWLHTASVRERQSFDAARQIVQAGENDKSMAVLQGRIRQMVDAERALLRDRQVKTDSSYIIAIVTGIVTAAMGLIAVGMFVWLLDRYLKSRQKAAAVIHDQRQLLQATLVSIGDGVITTDAAGKVMFLNAVAQRLTGWSNEEAHGRPLGEIFLIVNEDSRKPVENPALRALAEGKIVGLSSHTILIAKDGTEWPLDDSAAPIRDEQGTVNGAVLVFREVTERRSAELALRDADRRKDEFLATLAHELRNPLAPIRNGLEVIQLAKDDRHAIDQARKMMDRQLKQLVRLVDDLMDLSRISRGKIELRKEQVELAAVIHGAAETSRPLIEEMEHELTVKLPDVPVILEADPTRLAQVFLNLLNNAAKYTERGGRILLSAERQGSDVVVSVQDTGIGIAAGQLPQLFTMFTQLDHSQRSQGGLGIGLTLVKRLTELHGGRIEARSEGPGKGSEFIVRLPIVIAPSMPQPSITHDSTPLNLSLRILIVDDNQDGADSLAMMLKIMGNETHTAYDGEEALTAAAQFQPDVILLDIGLPKLTGYEACQLLRAQPGGKDIVIIAQTGWGQEEDRQRTMEAGFDQHLIKPVDPQALITLLAQIQSAKV